jgi:hypothetical protein
LDTGSNGQVDLSDEGDRDLALVERVKRCEEARAARFGAAVVEVAADV